MSSSYFPGAEETPAAVCPEFPSSEEPARGGIYKTHGDDDHRSAAADSQVPRRLSKRAIGKRQETGTDPQRLIAKHFVLAKSDRFRRVANL
jgi:hypothetical protein